MTPDILAIRAKLFSDTYLMWCKDIPKFTCTNIAKKHADAAVEAFDEQFKQDK